MLVPTRLHQAMRYAVLDGGKRVRPLLVYAAGEVTRPKSDALDRAALAVEFVHAYSLVHDDMPCMDNDVLRRGKPTVHVEFDEATAMLAGDALQAEAFKVIADGGLAGTADRGVDTRTGTCVVDLRHVRWPGHRSGRCRHDADHRGAGADAPHENRRAVEGSGVDGRVVRTGCRC